MIAVDRTKVSFPASLDARNRDGLTELDRARAFIAQREALPAGDKGRKKSFSFSAYKGVAVKKALDDLFHGKCAYCESDYSSTQPVDVEHYRPKNAVEDDADHPGYWWLAMAWDNLLPSCIDCNRRRTQSTPDPSGGSLAELNETDRSQKWRKVTTGKQAAFPLAQGSFRASSESDVVEQENRLLLDPTRDNPDDHLLFCVDREHLLGLVYPRPATDQSTGDLPQLGEAGAIEEDALANGASAMGAVSVQVYGLNRLGLVQARSRHLRDLEFLLALLTSVEEARAEVNERRRIKLAERRAARDDNDSALEGRLTDEIAFINGIRGHLRVHRDAVQEQMRRRIEPSAPYAAQARAWLNEVLSR